MTRDDHWTRPGPDAAGPAWPPRSQPVRRGQLANVLQNRLQHARQTAARLQLSPEATAAVEDAVTSEPYLLDNGILKAMGRAGLGERTALMMPYAAEGPRRQPGVLGQLAAGALAAQAENPVEADSWLTAAERTVSAARGTIRRVRAPALRGTPLLQSHGARQAELEPGM